MGGLNEGRCNLQIKWAAVHDLALDAVSALAGLGGEVMSLS